MPTTGCGPSLLGPRPRPPRRRRAGSAVALLLGIVAGTAACATDDTPGEAAADSAPTFVGHVHALGTDPGDGTAYVAAHGGVFAERDGELELVADRAQDTMGFTVVGPRHFLASGHPDLRELDRPTHLGLIESRDAARSWTEIALAGEADFHALDVGVGIYGYDSVSGRLMADVSGTAERWRTLWSGQALDIAASPRTATVLVTTPSRDVVEVNRAGESRAVRGAPPLVLVDWSDGDTVVGADADGRIWRSDDTGTTWTAVGRPMGAPQAIDMTPGRWLLATHERVWSSTDEGGTWTPLVALPQ